MPSKGNKSRKIQFDRYKGDNRYAKNKVLKLAKVLDRNPNDKNAQVCLQKYKTELGLKK